LQDYYSKIETNTYLLLALAFESKRKGIDAMRRIPSSQLVRSIIDRNHMSHSSFKASFRELMRD